MCGIIGFLDIKDGATKIPLENFLSGIKVCQKRGMEASGWYGDSLFKKAGVPIETATENSELLEKALSGSFLMYHTRSSTIGFDGPAPPGKNENNHPFEGNRFVVIHNGVIRYTPKLREYKYAGTCDSELVLGLVETFGVEKGVQFLDESDSFSLVIYDKKTEEVHFVRHGNPMIFSLANDGKTIYFGSTADIVLELDPGVSLGNLDMWKTGQCSSTPENVLFTWNGKGFSRTGMTFRKTLAELSNYKEFEDYVHTSRTVKTYSAPANVRADAKNNRDDELFLQMVGGRIYFDEPLDREFFHGYGASCRLD